MRDGEVTHLHADILSKKLDECIAEQALRKTRKHLETFYLKNKSHNGLKYLNMTEEEQLAYSKLMIDEGLIKPTVSLDQDRLKELLEEKRKEKSIERSIEIPISQHKDSITAFKQK
jgi:hypothetical protein